MNSTSFTLAAWGNLAPAEFTQILSDMFCDFSKPLKRLDDPRFASFILHTTSKTVHLKEVQAMPTIAISRAISNLHTWLQHKSTASHPMRPNATYLLVKLASADENAIPSPLFVDKAVVVSPKKEPFRGGFAAVREGRLHGDTVAIKELYPRGLSGAKLRKQLFREGLVWQHANHPNILKFKGIERTESAKAIPRLIAEWCPGGNLRSYVAEYNPSTQRREELLVDCTLGLDYLHCQNIVHGDVRASNALIHPDGRAVLADFGLAGIDDVGETNLMTTTAGSGSDHFKAPELLAPERFGTTFKRTPATDMYSYASLCLEMFTGWPQFPNRTGPLAILDILDQTPFPRPAEVLDLWWAVIKHCLQFLPELRPTARQALEVIMLCGVRAARDALEKRPHHKSVVYSVVANNSYPETPEYQLPLRKHDILEVLEVFPAGINGRIGRMSVRKRSGRLGMINVDQVHETSKFVARSVQDYTGDPNPDSKSGLPFLSLAYRESVDVLDLGLRHDKWTIRKNDGQIGLVPAAQLQISRKLCTRRARVLCSYHPGPSHRAQKALSLVKDQVIFIDPVAGDWVPARMNSESGIPGVAPFRLLEMLPEGKA